MPGDKNFLKNRYVQIMTLALVAHGALYYSAFGNENVPVSRPLSSFPAQLERWTMERDYGIEKEVQDVLRADDTLNRLYTDRGTGASAFLFVAYFKTQRAGQAPHSPKNCLPGAGWEPAEDSVVEVAVPGLAEPIRVNRYVVAKGDQRSVTYYWYQSRDRVIAKEYAAKIWLVADSIRYHRSDTALIKIVVPSAQGHEERSAAVGVEFLKTAFPAVRQFLPS